MKVYSRVVFDMNTLAVLEEEYTEYTGPWALAGGSGGGESTSRPQYIFPELRGGIVEGANQSIINPAIGQDKTINYTTSVGGNGSYTVPMTLTDINMNRAINQVRGGYGARGLANSGIAIAGEQNAIGQLALQGQQQAAQNLNNLLSAGTGNIQKSEQSTGVSVVCSELNRQGLLDDVTWEADCYYAKQIPPEAIRGYHIVAKPIVKAMQRWSWATSLAYPIAAPWAQAMRHRVRGDCPDTFIGRMLLKFGVPLMSFIGRIGHDRCK